jgi:uncharacterized protein YkwD
VRERRSRRALGAAFLLAAVSGCIEVPPAGEPAPGLPRRPAERPPAPAPPPGGDAGARELADAVHAAINDHRESRGLDPLDQEDHLSDVAEEHSRRMADGEVPFGHSGFERRAAAIRAEGPYRSIAENVGYNRGVADPAADAVARWLGSPQHRANVLGDFEETGIGVAGSPARGWWFTQMFVKPR